MELVRNLLCSSVIALLSWPMLAAAQSLPPLAYDVSSVRPHDQGAPGMSGRVDADGFSIVNTTLKNVIASGWHVQLEQVIGAPSWTDTLHWDITGKSTELTPEQLKKLTNEQKSQMMQQLLAERFHLKAHLETRTGPVFTLSPAKGGIKLQPIPMTPEEKAAGTAADSRLGMTGGAAVVMEANRIPLSMLMGTLVGNLHQTTIDKTGLPTDAVYSFTLRWASDAGVGTAADSDAPPLPIALREQLGIHVEAGKGPVQVLVIDHVEKPTSN